MSDSGENIQTPSAVLTEEQLREQQHKEETFKAIWMNPDFDFIESIDFVHRKPVAINFEILIPDSEKEFCIGFIRRDPTFTKTDYYSPDFWEFDHVNIWCDPTNPRRLENEGNELTTLEELMAEIEPLGLTLDDMYRTYLKEKERMNSEKGVDLLKEFQ